MHEYSSKNIGIGLCELKFKHANTRCWFAITHRGMMFNIGIVFCFLFYKKLTKTTGGRTISIPLVNSGNNRIIRNIAENIDIEIIKQARDLAFDYSIIVKKDRSRLILPCQKFLKENGYADDIYLNIIASIKKCINYYMQFFSE